MTRQERQLWAEEARELYLALLILQSFEKRCSS